MNLKSACLVALVASLVAAGATRAQPYSSPLTDLAGPPTSPLYSGAGTAAGAPGEGAPAPTGPGRLSDYIIGTRHDCCGPIGGDGPIGVELYVRWGPSLPLDAGFFGKTLATGWLVQGGGRSLFFNPEGTAAWTVDASISNVSNHGQRSNEMAILRGVVVPREPTFENPATSIAIPALAVTTSHLNRTYVNLALGREWWLTGGARTCHANGCDGCGWAGRMWRAGFDAGGRWGTAKLEMHEIRHRTDVIGAVFVSGHTDLEIPCGCCIFVVGGRVEWDYTWTDILQATDADLQNVNLLMTLGVRF
jgi:hypothetical protein